MSKLKILIIVFLLTLTVNALTLPAQAQIQGTDWKTKLDATAGDSSGGYQTGTPTSLATVIGNVIKIVLGLLGVILLILIIYGGFLWMTSQGEEEKVGKAKKIIGSAVIGVIIVVLAYTITIFVIAKLTTGITTPSGTAPNIID